MIGHTRLPRHGVYTIALGEKTPYGGGFGLVNGLRTASLYAKASCQNADAVYVRRYLGADNATYNVKKIKGRRTPDTALAERFEHLNIWERASR